MNDGWGYAESPFHDGERQAQRRQGVRDDMEVFARRVIRDHIPEQHRAFYRQLPFVLLGSVDDAGRPWASLLPGTPGFIDSPDPRRLGFAAVPLPGDPLHDTLRPGADLGLLGIELESRRRNRLSGRVDTVGPHGFTVDVRQAFGNCPQYIQRRRVTPRTVSAGNAKFSRGDGFDAPTRQLIERADTLFIATAHQGATGTRAEGADVSHRGGRPGFVRVEDARSFVLPDFAGNNHFNTVGNLLLDPRAGFLFVDFDAGDLVYMTGTAEVIWDGDAVAAFAGAERLLRFRAEAVIRVGNSLPFGFEFAEASPTLAATGSWAEADAGRAGTPGRQDYVDYEVVEVRPESDTITSFHLRRADGAGLADFEPGQFLPVRVAVDGRAQPCVRTYTLSDAPGIGRYRLSVKREAAGGVSDFLHAHARPGFRLQAMPPRGRFVLDAQSPRPVLLLSAGVGITPMIAMANALAAAAGDGGRTRPVFFVHGARNGRAMAFADHLRALAAQQDDFHLHVCFSRPDDADRLGESHDSEGRIDAGLLRRLLPLDDYDVYLCGPPGFMQAVYDDLRALGVGDDRIRAEAFGPAGLARRPADAAAGRPAVVADAAVPVTFADSGVEATWNADSGSLLELAEAAGLSPDFACRSGVCGTCATRLVAGAVAYTQAPLATPSEDEILLCCAVPAATAAGDEAPLGLVLEL